MRSPDQPPASFWQEVLSLDQQLFDTVRTKQNPGLTRLGHASEIWEYVTSADDIRDDYPFTPEDRRRLSQWETNHPSRLGALCMRSIKGLLVISQPINRPGTRSYSRQVDQLEERIFSYALLPRNPAGSMLVTHIRSFDPQEDLPPRLSEPDRITMDRSGLFAPTPEQYDAFLDEMRRGASGECLAPLPEN